MPTGVFDVRMASWIKAVVVGPISTLASTCGGLSSVVVVVVVVVIVVMGGVSYDGITANIYGTCAGWCSAH